MNHRRVSCAVGGAFLFFGLLASCPAQAAVCGILALGLATGFMHYLLDRAAFRFSSPDVRQAARGLLQS